MNTPADPNRANAVPAMATQYFTDLAAEGRADTEENCRVWLWFSCPAAWRGDVRAEIVRLRGNR